MSRGAKLIIAITGLTGSGKSTIAKILSDKFEDCTVVNFDWTRTLLLNDKAVANSFIASKLRNWRAGNVQWIADANNKEISLFVSPSSVMIIDGYFDYKDKEFCDLVDLKIHVSTSADISLARTVRKNVVNNFCTLNEVLSAYATEEKLREFVTRNVAYTDISIPCVCELFRDQHPSIDLILALGPKHGLEKKMTTVFA